LFQITLKVLTNIWIRIIYLLTLSCQKCPTFLKLWNLYLKSVLLLSSILFGVFLWFSFLWVSFLWVSFLWAPFLWVSFLWTSFLWVSFCFMSQGLITMPRNTSFSVQIMMAWYTYLSRWFWDRNRKCVIKKHWQSSHLSRIIRVDYYLKSMVKKCEKTIEHFKTFLNFQTTF